MVKNIIIIASMLLTINIFAFPVLAGCISDCKSDYESAVESCQMMYGDDPDDDYVLKSCIEDAKSEYESCEEECTS